MLIHKRKGETTGDFSKRLKDTYNWKKVAICGKLDPMARGLTHVLVNDKTKLMEDCLNTVKEYEFNIVDGISTDSDDVLGLQKVLTNIRHKNMIETYMDNIRYRSRQKFHHFSAKRLVKNGLNKPLWYWYKEGNLKDSEIPSKEITVYNVEKLSESQMPILDYRDRALYDVNTLKSNKFNKENIVKSWNSLEDYSMKPLDIYKYKITVSSGFYVRMIAKELNDLGVNCHINDINRTNVHFDYKPSYAIV